MPCLIYFDDSAVYEITTFDSCAFRVNQFYIPDSVLLNLIRNNSGFAYDMMQIACKELGDSNRYIRDIAQKSVKERLAEILLLIADDFGINAPQDTIFFTFLQSFSVFQYSIILFYVL